MKHRLIGEIFPIEEISKEASHEKRLRNGHISTLHVWWARRPLTASRASIYASLVDPPKNIEEWGTKRESITKISSWKNSNNIEIIQNIRKEIFKSQNSIPKVLDPFAGGGSIPLESVRLGCETYCSDYNPVAVLILKCVAEFPQKFGVSVDFSDKLQTKKTNKLLDNLKKWGNVIEKETEKELMEFYPSRFENEVIVGYIWSWILPCQNPSCQAEIPLFSQYRLVQKQNRKISLFPTVSNKEVKFKIVGDGYEKPNHNFDSSKGNYAGGKAICHVCGYVTKADITRKLFQNGKTVQKLICVVSYQKGKSGKNFRLADEDDKKVFLKAKQYLDKKRKILLKKWGIDPVPTEPTPDGGGPGAERSLSLKYYGMEEWGDLFNSRQKLALITFCEKVRDAYHQMISDGYDQEYAKAITTYLALGVDRLSNYGSILCRLNSTGGRGVANTFGAHTLIMVPNFIESNPFNPSGGGWKTSCQNTESFVEANSMFGNPAKIDQSSATRLKFPDNYFDAVFTDPPYYDNIAYSRLSDFFYVWLKRMLGELYPELFTSSLTPKSEEIVTYGNIEGGIDAGKAFFEDNLKKSFKEIYRVLKPEGIAVIIYAHKSTDGWETLINSLLESGLIITASWPIHTEMKERIISQDTASLASSIYMVVRKWKKEKIGFYRDVRNSLKKHLRTKLDNLWEQGISGADFFISAIGASLEIFGKYEQIVDDNDTPIKTCKLLDDIRILVSDYTLKQVIENGFSTDVSAMTRFYVIWRWAYGERKVSYDDALKLSQGLGIDLVKELNKGFIKKEKDYVKVLNALDRKEKDLLLSKELIDILQLAVLYWKQNKRKELVQLLSKTRYGSSDIFFRVAQAIIDANPGSNETKLLEGFHSGRKQIEEKIELNTKQTKLL